RPWARPAFLLRRGTFRFHLADPAHTIAPLLLIEPIKGLPGTRRGKKPIEKANPPVPVVAEDPIKPLLLDLELLVDGCGRTAGRPLTRGGLRQFAVIGLLPAREDIREVEALWAIIPLQEAAPAGRRQDDSERTGGHHDFLVSVEVEIGYPHRQPCAPPVRGRLRACLGLDEIPVGLMPQVVQVEPAEEPVP